MDGVRIGVVVNVFFAVCCRLTEPGVTDGVVLPVAVAVDDSEVVPVELALVDAVDVGLVVAVDVAVVVLVLVPGDVLVVGTLVVAVVVGLVVAELVGELVAVVDPDHDSPVFFFADPTGPGPTSAPRRP